MDKFDNIKTQSCTKFLALTKCYKTPKNFCIDFGSCILTLGQAEYDVLPVATVCDQARTVFAYGKKHPSGFAYPQLNAAIKIIACPRKYVAPITQPNNGSTSCFQFG